MCKQRSQAGRQAGSPNQSAIHAGRRQPISKEAEGIASEREKDFESVYSFIHSFLSSLVTIICSSFTISAANLLMPSLSFSTAIASPIPSKHSQLLSQSQAGQSVSQLVATTTAKRLIDFTVMLPAVGLLVEVKLLQVQGGGLLRTQLFLNRLGQMSEILEKFGRDGHLVASSQFNDFSCVSKACALRVRERMISEVVRRWSALCVP